MTRWLVTGASGFIGEPVVARLAGAGLEVHGCTRRQAGPARGVTWHAVDLLDHGRATDLVSEVRPSHLLHLAWETTPGAYRESTRNGDWLEASVSLVRAFAQSGGERFVGVGTGEEYQPREEPCDEAAPIAPRSRYAAAKAALSGRLASLADELGFSFAWCRVFQAYGPREHPSRLIPSAIASLVRGERFECSEGSQLRDFVHVDDVASALVHVGKGRIDGPVNVASGTGATVRSVIERVAAITGKPHLVSFGARPMDPEEPAVLTADTGRLRSTAWVPSVDLDAGLKAMVAAWT